MGTNLINLLSLLLPLGTGQSAGTWRMNASIPNTDPTTTGCVVLAQLTSGTPPTLQALYPICPPGTPNAATDISGANINFPLAANAGDGNGVNSDLAIYGGVKHVLDRTDIYMAQPSCVMKLSNAQVQYLFKTSLTWNNGLQELWDNTGNGFIATEGTTDAMTCGTDETLLPSSLYLPDPYIAPATDDSWKVPIKLSVQKPVVKGVLIGVPSSSASMSTSTGTSLATLSGSAVFGVETGSTAATVTEVWTTTVIANARRKRFDGPYITPGA